MAENQGFENFEYYDMLACISQWPKNVNAYSQLYFNRYPERRQQNKMMFYGLKSNLISVPESQTVLTLIFLKSVLMEEALQLAILAGGDDEDIEFLILDNLLIDRDNVLFAPPFDLNNFTDEEVILNFRFQRAHLEVLRHHLRIPDIVRSGAGDSVDGLTALCIVLRRLAYPARLSDLSRMFSRSPQSLSQIITTTTEIILAERGYLLEHLNALQWLNREKLEMYAEAINLKGGAINNCWGFIDGTARLMCRPSVNQEEYYSGHKKGHCLKYQSVLCPDGIIVNMLGGYPGRRHDAGIFRESNLYQQLEEKARFGEQSYVLYGDQGYGLMDLLITPFPGQRQNLPPEQNAFNASMKILRVAVEWGFGKIISEFAFTDFKKNQKLLMQDLQCLYKVAVLLTNAHTCLYGSQTATYFNVIPPNINEYFPLI